MRIGACDCSVDRGTGDREQLFEFADGVLAAAVQLDQVGLLLRAELGLGVADLEFGHGTSVPVSLPPPGRFTEPVLRDSGAEPARMASSRRRCAVGGSAYGTGFAGRL